VLAGVDVAVGWEVNVGVGRICPREQDKVSRVKAITNKRGRERTKRVLIALLLADRVLQFSQSFDLDADFIAML
jgi:hypothetical protein